MHTSISCRSHQKNRGNLAVKLCKFWYATLAYHFSSTETNTPVVGKNFYGQKFASNIIHVLGMQIPFKLIHGYKTGEVFWFWRGEFLLPEAQMKNRYLRNT